MMRHAPTWLPLVQNGAALYCGELAPGVGLWGGLLAELRFPEQAS